MGQAPMANADHSIAFWRSVAATFRRDRAVLFELFNEPFFERGFAGDPWAVAMRGTGGAFEPPWRVAGYQALVDAVRAAGAKNVVLVGAPSWSADLSGWLAHRPADPTGQLAAAWHPYPPGDAAWGSAEYAQPRFAPQVYADAEAILDAGIPLVITETGDRNAPGTAAAPLVENVTRWADAHGVGVIGFGWNVWREPANVLIRDADGTPTDGYGRAFRAWLLSHE
jgi:hypothetical protein